MHGHSNLALARRDRIVAVVLLVVIVALAWGVTLHQAWRIQEMEIAMRRDMQMSMNGMQPLWTRLETAIVFTMWTAMMAAMLLPGAIPMIAAFATINRRRRQRGAPYVPTAIFLAGFLAVWAGFSELATALQWLLQKAELLTTMMQSESRYFSAALFILAGVYQFTLLKQRGLDSCR